MATSDSLGLSVTATDKSPLVRRRAAWALGAIEDETALTHLERALRDRDASVRRTATWAMGEIESAKAVPMLRTALTDINPDVRRTAIWAVGEIEDASGVDVLAPLVKDGDARVRRMAVWALEEIESGRAVGVLASAVRNEIAAIDADLPIWLGPFTLDERLQWGYAFNGSMAVLFLLFAAISLLLASVGLYAVIAHAVSQRTQEIGIRTAMGATGRDVLQLVLREGMLPVGVGLTVGLATTMAVSPILRSQLVQVSPADPLSLLVAIATLVLSAALASVIPARRAMRVDPVVTLRRT